MGNIKLLSCEACNLFFKQKRNLLVHLKSHFEKTNCKLCFKEVTEENLKNHMIFVHDKQSQQLNYDCRYCARKFPTPIHRNSHENDVHKDGKNPFICKLCGLNFLKKEDVRLHNLETHHDGLFFHCSFSKCDRFFKTEKLLKIHENIHKEAGYKCPLCKKSFKQSSNYSKHKKRCKGPLIHKTDEELLRMSEMAKQQYELLKVKENAKKVRRTKQETANSAEFKDEEIEKMLPSNNEEQICDKCGMQFSNKREFEKHQMMCNFMSNVPKVAPLKAVSIKCPEIECSITFASQGSLIKHISQVHLKERQFQCDKCLKFYKTKQHLKIHLQIHSVPKTCPICGVLLPNIEAHIKRHEISKAVTFSCPQCNKKCSTKQVLNEHIQRIHEKKPLGKLYSCSVCHENYIRNCDLRRHSFVHYQGKIYSCNFSGCTEMFKTSYKLQLHQIVHDEMVHRNHTCEVCSKSFIRQTALYKHKKTHLKKTKVVNF